MQVGVVTLFPEMLSSALQYGVVGRAQQSGLLQLILENPRDWALDKHRTVDDRPFGGGPGMVMKPGPLLSAIQAVKQRVGDGAAVVYLSPQGRLFNQAMARSISTRGQLVLVAGRYEGIDERVIQGAVDEEISLGDFILSGGEFAAMTLIDAVVRLVPGVLGHPDSSLEDSFGVDSLLDYPHYTRPESYQGNDVPPVLLSGDHNAIAKWRRQQSLSRTMNRRPELLEHAFLTADDREFLTSLGYRSERPVGSNNKE
ncbi:MAG: tRNA (guanosine(37)-N1)-methyltransferase TrmD [Granulosicoccus sp.]